MEANENLANTMPFTHRSVRISGNFLDPLQVVPTDDKFTQITTLIILNFFEVEIRKMAVLSPITSAEMLYTVF